MPVIPILWEAKIGVSLEPRSLRPVWATEEDPISTNNNKAGAVAHGCIPATWEAEAEESLEPGGQRLQ